MKMRQQQQSRKNGAAVLFSKLPMIGKSGCANCQSLETPHSFQA
jgi:hypothetical protein